MAPSHHGDIFVFLTIGIGYISVLQSVGPNNSSHANTFQLLQVFFQNVNKFGCFCPINFNHKYLVNNGLQWISPKIIPRLINEKH